MIPWWFSSIRRFSSLPIHIIDIDLPDQRRAWCDKYGIGRTLFSLNKSPAQKQEIDEALAKLWESNYLGNVWQNREVWFAKPEVLQKTPFQKTLFLDLDCEVKGPIDSLLELPASFAICKNPDFVQEEAILNQLIRPGESIYNSGVILYERGHPLIDQWANLSYETANQHMGDEDILSLILNKTSTPFDLIPEAFNCRPTSQNVGKAHVVHHVGIEGKRNIMAQILYDRLGIQS